MFISANAGAAGSDDFAAVPPSGGSGGGGRFSFGEASPTLQPEDIRHLVFGTLPAVRAAIKKFHQLGYAEPNDWSRPIPTDNDREVMVVLTKRMNVL